MPRGKKLSQTDQEGARHTRVEATQPAAPATCMQRLTRHPLLTAEEEQQLASRARSGDPLAKNQLVEANMRLVMNLAKQYHSSLVPFEDLVQEGAIGLITACERYDPSRGFRFSTYATHWVRQAISRAIDNKARSIRVPAHVAETLRKIDRARVLHQREHDEEPTIEQIAERLSMPPRRVIAYLFAGQDPLSLDMLVGDDDNTPLAALINDRGSADPETTVIREEVESELREIMDTLSERERAVMRRRLGFEGDAPQVLQDIGADLRISRERVRQIEVQALKHLRAIATRRGLWQYLVG